MPACSRHHYERGPSLGMGTAIAAFRRRHRGCWWNVLYVEGRSMTKSPNHSRLPLYCFVVFVFIFAATPAEAHLNSTGMGPIYDGLMHFSTSPEDLAPVLALS